MGQRLVGLGGIKNDRNVGQEDGGVIYRNGEVTERRRFGGWGSGPKGDFILNPVRSLVGWTSRWPP